MDFKNKVYEFSAKVNDLKEYISTEEATKNALILPFLQMLGYDPFNPVEVYPEYTSDIGTKKGEKVDYAIMFNDTPTILVECKDTSCNLNQNQCNQLHRYFTNTKARIAILTNGIEYRFYSDLEESNKMDLKPFMIFNIEEPEEALIPELKKITKDKFNLYETLSAASELKYTREIKKVLASEVKDPSEDFIKLLASKVYPGRLTKQVREWFAEIVKDAVSHYINDVINERLSSAMTKNEYQYGTDNPEGEPIEDSDNDDKKSEIITTEDEIEAYYIIKSILREIVDPDRITMKDTKSYCGILLDNNTRKPICRLYLETSNWYIGIFNEERQEEKYQIQSLNEIFNYADKIKELPEHYNV